MPPRSAPVFIPVSIELTVLPLVTALLLGAAIGIEREVNHHVGGLRTNALVALGAAAFTLFSATAQGTDSMARVAAQVVSGIGFLGGGVILREGLTIRGLSTAATIWCAAAVGVFAGAGHLAEAATVAAIIVLANLVLRPIVLAINRRQLAPSAGIALYELRLTCRAEEEGRVRALLLREAGAGALSLRSIESRPPSPGGDGTEVIATLFCAARNDHAVEETVGRLVLDNGVIGARWQLQPMAA